ncbi:ribosomal protein S12 methylthiotransferase [Lachnospiraceae bacterium PFB1-21]
MRKYLPFSSITGKVTQSHMKVYFISLGCDKNLVDTEVMLGLLGERGYSMTDFAEEAEVLVVNTCCFIHDAKEESVAAILEMADLKKETGAKALIVTGCMAQRYQQEIREEIPEVDGVLGTNAYDQIIEAIDEAVGGRPSMVMKELQGIPQVASERLLTTGGHYAYLKIAEGCDKHCTYCIIPTLRGRYRSVPLETLVKEAKSLVEKGVKELILVAQETTVYGKDIYGEKSLAKLLSELAKIEDLHWIRILYCYPEEIDNELITAIKTEKKVCHYLDLPIQHISDNILKAMGRRTTKKQLLETIAKLRREIPDICLRTSLITGFPGETPGEHQELLEFVRQIRFDRLGVFTYSQEEGTPAAELANQVPEEVKEARRDELMSAQQEVAFAKAQEKIGQTLEVFIEGKIADEDVYVGRSYMDAPNVDGFVFATSEYPAESGDFIRVKVTEAKEYDLIGDRIDEFTE